MKAIKDIKSGQPIAASPGQTLADIANTMHSQAIVILPVKEKDKVVGHTLRTVTAEQKPNLALA